MLFKSSWKSWPVHAKSNTHTITSCKWLPVLSFYSISMLKFKSARHLLNKQQVNPDRLHFFVPVKRNGWWVVFFFFLTLKMAYIFPCTVHWLQSNINTCTVCMVHHLTVLLKDFPCQKVIFFIHLENAYATICHGLDLRLKKPLVEIKIASKSNKLSVLGKCIPQILHKINGHCFSW